MAIDTSVSHEPQGSGVRGHHPTDHHLKINYFINTESNKLKFTFLNSFPPSHFVTAPKQHGQDGGLRAGGWLRSPNHRGWGGRPRLEASRHLHLTQQQDSLPGLLSLKRARGPGTRTDVCRGLPIPGRVAAPLVRNLIGPAQVALDVTCFLANSGGNTQSAKLFSMTAAHMTGTCKAGSHHLGTSSTRLPSGVHLGGLHSVQGNREMVPGFSLSMAPRAHTIHSPLF